MSDLDDQLQRMMNYCSGYARSSIEEAGNFDPFGAVIDQAGIIEGLIFGDLEGRQTAAEIYAIAAASIERKFNEGQILAAALVTNTRMPSDVGSDYPTAIKFEIETTERSIRMYLPYEIIKRIFRRPQVAFGQWIDMADRKASSDG